MRRALELAERGRGAVSPNPVVGAVIVAAREGEDGSGKPASAATVGGGPESGEDTGRGAANSEPAGVIGEGYHAAYGGLHAERAALADCAERGEDPRGATMYVTLEPCAHTGRQPPCVEAVLEAGIARVVIAADDPSAKAAGAGPKALRAANSASSVAAHSSPARSPPATWPPPA